MQAKAKVKMSNLGTSFRDVMQLIQLHQIKLLERNWGILIQASIGKILFHSQDKIAVANSLDFKELLKIKISRMQQKTKIHYLIRINEKLANFHFFNSERTNKNAYEILDIGNSLLTKALFKNIKHSNEYNEWMISIQEHLLHKSTSKINRMNVQTSTDSLFSQKQDPKKNLRYLNLLSFISKKEELLDNHLKLQQEKIQDLFLILKPSIRCKVLYLFQPPPPNHSLAPKDSTMRSPSLFC